MHDRGCICGIMKKFVFKLEVTLTFAITAEFQIKLNRRQRVGALQKVQLELINVRPCVNSTQILSIFRTVETKPCHCKFKNARGAFHPGFGGNASRNPQAEAGIYLVTILSSP